MTSFLSRFRTLAEGTANDLLNKAIDMNSPTMLRQYVRELEEAEGKLKTEAAVAAGGVRTLTRQKGDLEHHLADETAAAKTSMATNPAAARIHASTAVTLQTDLAAKTQEVVDQTTLSANLDAALAKLDAKHSQMVSAVRRLESMDRSTKAKEQAAGALENANAAANSGDGISIDNIQQKMQGRNDVAEEKFSRAMNDPGMAEDPTHTADVDAFLANLK